MQALARMRSQASSVAESPQRRKGGAGGGGKRALTPAAKSPKATPAKKQKSRGADQGPAADRARGSAAASSVPEDDDLEGAEVEAGKTCAACWRSFKTDKAFLTAGADFAWLYADGRGAYCRDCANTYRVMPKAGMNLGYFELWITQLGHRLLFWKELVAYMSLKKDGLSHVTMALISARLNMLEWLFNFLQLPWPIVDAKPADAAFMQALASGHDLGARRGSNPGCLGRDRGPLGGSRSPGSSSPKTRTDLSAQGPE